MPKMNVNLYVIEDYENEPPSGPKKQTQNKPNSNPIKACPERIEFRTFDRSLLGSQLLAKSQILQDQIASADKQATK
jgi:hypothetical protein